MKPAKLWGVGALAVVAAFITVVSAWGGASVAVAGASNSAAVAAVSAPASPSWSLAQLERAATATVVDSEPGIGVRGATYVGAADIATVPVLVALSYSHPAELSAYLAALSNPASPQYHEYMTQAQFDRTFGGSTSVYDSALAYFESFGVTGVVTYADQASIAFYATPAQIAGIFHAPLGEYKTGAGAYYALASAPRLPAPLASYVVGVVGLSDYSQYTIHADSHLARSPISAAAASIPSSAGIVSTPCTTNGGPFVCTTVNGLRIPKPLLADNPAVEVFCSPSDTACSGEMLMGSDFQVAYDELNPATWFSHTLFGQYGYPVGADIATILWSDPVENFTGGYCGTLNNQTYAMDFYGPDVSSYLSYMIPKGEPMPTATSVAMRGPYVYATGDQGLSAGCDSGGAELENTLDMDMEGVMAPGSNIFQVFGQGPTSATVNTAFTDILNPAPKDGPGFTPSTVAGLKNVSVIANSWGYGTTLNFTVWYHDLEQAQARGITVVASSGDVPSESNSAVSAPASQAYNDFGDVAVGGTTLTLNPNTLERSPVTRGSNPYTVCTGSAICGSEIAWYEPVGTVYGFGVTLGSVGGVTAKFPEPSWQLSSSDANAVIQADRSGRGVPDIAMDANNTPISVVYFGYALNITCMVTSSCSGPPGFVQGYYTYVVGTSISDQLAGGVIATINHALWEAKKPWLGFINPTAYVLGQEQFNGLLYKNAFFDVIFGGNTKHPALTGYDLATGWGALDALNDAQFALAGAFAGPAATHSSSMQPVGGALGLASAVRRSVT